MLADNRGKSATPAPSSRLDVPNPVAELPRTTAFLPAPPHRGAAALVGDLEGDRSAAIV
jgi:hypothetical protein